MDTEKIVQNIQRACKAKGVTPTVAARESGAGQNMVTAMKKEGRIPSVEKMSMLASYLGVTTSELLGEEIASTPMAGGGPRYPPEYDLLDPEDRALIHSMIRRLILEKNQGDASSPSNGAGSETA